MVGASEVDHLKVEHLLLEIGGVPECERELDAFERSSLNPREEPKEGGSTRSETGPRDPHAVEGASIEDVQATPTIHQHLHEARPPNDWANDERETTQARNVPGEVLAAKGDGHLRPVEALLRHPIYHVDPHRWTAYGHGGGEVGPPAKIMG